MIINGGFMRNKKVILIIGIALILSIILVIILLSNNKFGIKELTFSEVTQKIDNKENFVLVVSKTNCPYCEAFLPKIEKIAKKNKFVVFYIEIDKLSKSENQEFSSKVAYVNGTPTTIFIEDGEEKIAANRINGNVSEEKINSKLRLYGYID